MHARGLIIFVAFTITAAGCAEKRTRPETEPNAATPAALDGRTRDAEERHGRGTAVGLASYYGRAFHGERTASGTTFNMHALVAAHPRYPFGTRVRVTNLDNGRSVIVRIVDRGPTQENVNEGVIIDLSQRAAATLGMIEDGRQRVRLQVLEWGEGT